MNLFDLFCKIQDSIYIDLKLKFVISFVYSKRVTLWVKS